MSLPKQLDKKSEALKEMFVPDLFVITAGVIFFCMALSLFPRTQRFYKETGSPLMLICGGVWLGILLQDKPWTGVACITAITVITSVNWKKLISRIGGLFRRSKHDDDAPSEP